MAWVLAIATFGLLLVGGLVTTYRVGMAVPDWPTTFQHNMFTYPLDGMLADWGVGVEHGHRLLASGVGLITIATVVVCFVTGANGTLRRVSLLALLAVIGQGLLGGARVLENSQHLAFLHGASAQLVYAVVAVYWVLSSPRWQSAERGAGADAVRGLRRRAWLAVALVYGQIALGAWLRHSGLPQALILHIVLAFGATGIVLALALRLAALARDAKCAPSAGATLTSLRTWLVGVLAAQLLLGAGSTLAIFVWSEGFQGSVSMGEAVMATLHVAVGALLLAGSVATLLWSYRLAPPLARTERADRSAVMLEGAR